MVAAAQQDIASMVLKHVAFSYPWPFCEVCMIVLLGSRGECGVALEGPAVAVAEGQESRGCRFLVDRLLHGLVTFSFVKLTAIN